MAFDVFISHASEDKETIAQPLADRLKALGYEVFLDKYSIKLGDSLPDKIGDGMMSSRYYVIIFSPNFLKKKWTKAELETALAIQITGNEKKILPLLHNLSYEEYVKSVPMLQHIVYANTSAGINAIVEQIRDVLEGPANTLDSEPKEITLNISTATENDLPLRPLTRISKYSRKTKEIGFTTAVIGLLAAIIVLVTVFASDIFPVFLPTDAPPPTQTSTITDVTTREPALGVNMTGNIDGDTPPSASIQLSPENKDAEAYNLKGISYVRQGKHDAAIEQYTKAIELDDDFGVYYYNRGRAYKFSGKYAFALSDFEKAKELNPNDEDFIREYNEAFGKVYAQEERIPIGTEQIVIAENIAVKGNSSYYDVESRITFSPSTINSSSIYASITIHGESTKRDVMHSGDVIEYSYNGRNFAFFLCSIDDANDTCIIAIREYIPFYELPTPTPTSTPTILPISIISSVKDDSFRESKHNVTSLLDGKDNTCWQYKPSKNQEDASLTLILTEISRVDEICIKNGFIENSYGVDQYKAYRRAANIEIEFQYQKYEERGNFIDKIYFTLLDKPDSQSIKIGKEDVAAIKITIRGLSAYKSTEFGDVALNEIEVVGVPKD